ncbi:hypothetical protein [Luteibacter yeojuensis]|uniref:Holin n=1 Tax=Luteibacter yeojuensis TaxID=345309 RepID=A0A7X5TQ29_9GAMM|nr:hypothetical protein [Luteibacter yeojuensis]NID16096.1 hypothetical protein [Luteibacter yeojuensis]
MSKEEIAGLWLLLAAVGGAIMPVALYTGGSQGPAVVRVVCGTFIAVFLSPAIGKRYMLDADLDVQAAVSFLVGCFGLNVTILAQKAIATFGEDVAKRFLAGIFKGVEK